MWSPESGLKFANNEPAPPNYEASQIFIFCEDHRGPGIQHVALTLPNLVESVAQIRQNGAQFMSTPDAYYDLLPSHLRRIGVNAIEEDIEQLRRLGILVDGSEEGKYMMQIFLNEAASQFKDPQAGPFFAELIQRKGDMGFGAGNFRALFESIERQLQAEGRA
jgi:4-hydroxyphenylpyruvate dioxygenase